MSTAIRLHVKPGDTDKRYIHWGNGRWQEIGGALPITQGLNWYPEGNDAPFNWRITDDPHAASHVSDWNGPGGYVVARQETAFEGNPWIFPWGTAADVSPLISMAGHTIVDVSMDPGGSDAGYVLTSSGRVYAFGGAAVWGTQPQWDRVNNAARRLQVNWNDSDPKQYAVIDAYGRIWNGNGAPPMTINVPWGVANKQIAWIYDLACAFHIYDWTTGNGWMLLRNGSVVTINGAPHAPGGLKPAGAPLWWTDLVVLNDGTGDEPLRMAKLATFGAIDEWVVSTPPTVIVGGPNATPADPTTDTTRPTLTWLYTDPEGDAQQSAELAVIADEVWDADGLVNEVQRVTITGTPTGGVIRLSHNGETTADIAYNANAAAVQSALEGLDSIAVGDVAVSGGPLPGTAVDITFQGRLRKHNHPLMTAENALTGGASPAVTVTQVTAGTGIDPETATAVYRKTVEDAVTRETELDVDLANDTYRFYARVTDTSGLSSEWSIHTWTQNVTRPATPTLVITGGSGLSMQINGNVAGGPPADTVVGVQYRDSASDPWRWVRDAVALELDVSDDFTALDREAPFGVAREYRAIAYVPNPFVASDWSAGETGELNARVWALTVPENSALGGEIKVAPPFRTVRPARAGTFRPLGRRNPVVITEGEPGGFETDLTIWTLDTAAVNTLRAVVDAGLTMLLRDPYGNAWYIAVHESVEDELLRAAKLVSEDTPLRNAHQVTLRVTEVDRPLVGPTTGVLAFLE